MTSLLTWDLDGTLSDDRHRAHHYRANRYAEYFSYDAMIADPPYTQAVVLFNEMKEYGWEMAYLTARLERNRPVTLDWLTLHSFDTPDRSILRPEELAEMRPAEFKAAALLSLFASGEYERIVHVDNDPEVIERITADFGPDAAFLADWDKNPDMASIAAVQLSPVPQ